MEKWLQVFQMVLILVVSTVEVLNVGIVPYFMLICTFFSDEDKLC